MNEMLSAALEYAEKGFLVVPLERYGKHMLKDAFFHKASRNPEIINKWWEIMPEANVGIPTSLRRNKLIIIDVDVNNWVVKSCDCGERNEYIYDPVSKKYVH
jgi:hypothetical protein